MYQLKIIICKNCTLLKYSYARPSQMNSPQYSSYSPYYYISFIPLKNTLIPFHPEIFKSGVSYDVAHPQAKYVSTYAESWMETANCLSTSASQFIMHNSETY